MYRTIKKIVLLLVVMMNIFIMEETVNAENLSASTVILNVEQQFEPLANVYKETDLKGEYCILAKDNSYPLPENTKGGKFKFELQGKNSNRKLEFVFEQEGLYEYTIEQISSKRNNYIFDKNKYNVFVYVDRVGGKLASQVIVKNSSNNKVTSLIFNNTYKAEGQNYVKTGDDTNIFLWLVLWCVALGSIIFIFRRQYN